MLKAIDEPPDEVLIKETIRILKLKIKKDIIIFSNNQTEIIEINGRNENSK